MSLLMHTLHVDLGERSYPVYIGRDLLSDPELLSQHIQGSQLVIVSNETVAPLYLDRLRAAVGERALVTEIILPDGEQYKTMESLAEILDRVMADRHSRTTTLVALGGGVVGDITGFAAACYQRGVDFVQVPTTLLAQVDSSVGGKTAVNHPLGKNMIGAFYQPLADPAFPRVCRRARGSGQVWPDLRRAFLSLAAATDAKITGAGGGGPG